MLQSFSYLTSNARKIQVEMSLNEPIFTIQWIDFYLMGNLKAETDCWSHYFNNKHCCLAIKDVKGYFTVYYKTKSMHKYHKTQWKIWTKSQAATAPTTHSSFEKALHPWTQLFFQSCPYPGRTLTLRQKCSFQLTRRRVREFL